MPDLINQNDAPINLQLIVGERWVIEIDPETFFVEGEDGQLSVSVDVYDVLEVNSPDRKPVNPSMIDEDSTKEIEDAIQAFLEHLLNNIQEN